MAYTIPGGRLLPPERNTRFNWDRYRTIWETQGR